MNLYLLGILEGFFLGMLFYNLILQIAYKRGIVEYRGVKK